MRLSYTSVFFSFLSLFWRLFCAYVEVIMCVCRNYEASSTVNKVKKKFFVAYSLWISLIIWNAFKLCFCVGLESKFLDMHEVKLNGTLGCFSSDRQHHVFFGLLIILHMVPSFSSISFCVKIHYEFLFQIHWIIFACYQSSVCVRIMFQVLFIVQYSPCFHLSTHNLKRTLYYFLRQTLAFKKTNN